MALIDQYQMSQDAVFKQKVRMAMIKAALDIVGESQSSMSISEWRKRHNLGVAILNDPSAYIDRFAEAAATNTTIAAETDGDSVTDNDIETQIAGQFGDIAGVGQHTGF